MSKSNTGTYLVVGGAAALALYLVMRQKSATATTTPTNVIGDLVASVKSALIKAGITSGGASGGGASGGGASGGGETVPLADMFHDFLGAAGITQTDDGGAAVSDALGGRTNKQGATPTAFWTYEDRATANVINNSHYATAPVRRLYQ